MGSAQARIPIHSAVVSAEATAHGSDWKHVVARMISQLALKSPTFQMAWQVWHQASQQALKRDKLSFSETQTDANSERPDSNAGFKSRSRHSSRSSFDASPR